MKSTGFSAGRFEDVQPLLSCTMAGMVEAGIKPTVIAAIREAARQHGVRRVWLFGSRARGEHRPKSDIDLAVSGGDKVRF